MVIVCVPSSGTFEERFFDLNNTVREVLDNIVTEPTKRDNACLMFMGKILPEEIKLSDVKSMKNSYVLHVLFRPPKPVKSNMNSNVMQKLEECRAKMSKLPSLRQLTIKITEQLRDPSLISQLEKEFPELMVDHESAVFVSDMVLVCSLFLKDEETGEEEKFLTEHPVLVEALHYVLTKHVPWLTKSTTPAPGTSASSSDEDESLREEISETGNAPPSGIITAEMLREAMAYAARSMGGQEASSSASQPPPSAFGSSTVQPATSSNEQYATEIEHLVELGFSDIEQDRHVLEETGGDVDQAIELLIVIRESLNQ